MNYTGKNSLTKLIQLIKSKFDAISVIRGNVNITQESSTISIPITVSDSSKLLIYHNGILLIQGTHYTITDGSSIELLDYNTEIGDVISFVYHKV